MTNGKSSSSSFLNAARRRRAAGGALRLELALLVPLSLVLLLFAASAHGAWRLAAVPPAILLAGTAMVFPRLPRVLVADTLATIALAGAAVGLLVLGIGPHLLGYQPRIVLSGSMRPTFSPGDVLLVREKPDTQLRLGDVITYQIPVADHHVESHRIVKFVHRGEEPTVITKGDANPVADPWTATLHGGETWTTWHVVPKVGYAVLLLRVPLVRTLTLYVAPVLLFLLGALRLWLPELRLRRWLDARILVAHVLRF